MPNPSPQPIRPRPLELNQTPVVNLVGQATALYPHTQQYVLAYYPTSVAGGAAMPAMRQVILASPQQLTQQHMQQLQLASYHMPRHQFPLAQLANRPAGAIAFRQTSPMVQPGQQAPQQALTQLHIQATPRVQLYQHSPNTPVANQSPTPQSTASNKPRPTVRPDSSQISIQTATSSPAPGKITQKGTRTSNGTTENKNTKGDRTPNNATHTCSIIDKKQSASRHNDKPSSESRVSADTHKNSPPRRQRSESISKKKSTKKLKNLDVICHYINAKVIYESSTPFSDGAYKKKKNKPANKSINHKETTNSSSLKVDSERKDAEKGTPKACDNASPAPMTASVPAKNPTPGATPTKSVPQKRIYTEDELSKLDVEGVAKFLESNECAKKYAKEFRSQGIDGEALLTMLHDPKFYEYMKTYLNVDAKSALSINRFFSESIRTSSQAP